MKYELFQMISLTYTRTINQVLNSWNYENRADIGGIAICSYETWGGCSHSELIIQECLLDENSSVHWLHHEIHKQDCH